ncbi:phosphatidate cytidylyltransferase [Haloglycomyces albus]|uniref:phosphatidate cytidylyltransferase n=1 Tax=Haloglycomyces albus TaxID=526067 RepID=UPI00046D1FD6|nr:phosphatidate cytidylyltransferase [Haloglycomyces albus]
MNPSNDTPTEDSTEPASPSPGRNLPIAIGVGVGLGAVVVFALLWQSIIFFGLGSVALALACWEVSTAMNRAGRRVPIWPVTACGPFIAAMAWFGGGTGLALGTALAVAGILVWRLAEGASRYRTDVASSVQTLIQVPFLAGFILLLATSGENGPLQVLILLLMVVLSDTGGYTAGVLVGNHPMTPSISPKKSWEGLGGSVLAAALGGGLACHFIFEFPFYLGLAFGASVALAATLGDLAISVLKRDLNIKDMSHLIPGHGGLMDRLDSIVMAAPVGYLWFAYLLG